MDPVQFLKCISLFSLDRIIIYWSKLYDLCNQVALPVWFPLSQLQPSASISTPTYRLGGIMSEEEDESSTLGPTLSSEKEKKREKEKRKRRKRK